MSVCTKICNRRLPVALCLTVLLAACATGRVERAPSPPPLPPAPAAVAGTYLLSHIGGQTLPLMVKDDDNGCHTDIDSGKLSLHGGEFQLTRTSSRTCDGVVMARTVDRSHGEYGGTSTALVLAAHSGRLFQRAQARLRGATLLLRLPADAQGGGTTAWTFERAP